MYHDHFLRFANETEAEAALFDRVAGEFDTQCELRSRYLAIDVIGTIYKPTGETRLDENGMEFPVMAPISGWHVNVRHNQPAPELEPYQVFPLHPHRLWTYNRLGHPAADPFPTDKTGEAATQDILLEPIVPQPTED